MSTIDPVSSTSPAPSGSYAAGRVCHDADSHVMETPEWLDPFLDGALRDRLGSAGVFGSLYGRGDNAKVPRLIAEARERKQDREASARAAEGLIAGPKGWSAFGAFDAEERVEAINRLGFSRQLVFATTSLFVFRNAREPEVLYGCARAHNRAMAAFCSADPRLIAVGYIPTEDPDMAVREFDEAYRLGCRAMWLSAAPWGERSPGHPDFYPLWQRFVDNNVPFVLHIGPNSRSLPPEYVNNGKPEQPDLHGGGENLRFKDFVVLPYSAEMFLATLIYDGLFDQFPTLKGGVIEFGATWVPSFLRKLDHGYRSFSKSDGLLQALKLKPSEYMRRQIKFTPFPNEDAGHLIRGTGAELYLFSSDYPHPEGTPDPIGRFEATFHGVTDADREKFYRSNFEEMMGL